MTVRYLSFYAMPGVPREEYRDWLMIAFSDSELAALDIAAGNVPAGMIFEAGGVLWSVWSDNRIRRYM